jgi:hypothetical protein
MVAGDPVTAFGCNSDAAENIATANNNANFHAKRPRISNISCDPVCHGHVNPETLTSHQGFA